MVAATTQDANLKKDTREIQRLENAAKDKASLASGIECRARCGGVGRLEHILCQCIYCNHRSQCNIFSRWSCSLCHPLDDKST